MLFLCMLIAQEIRGTLFFFLVHFVRFTCMSKLCSFEHVHCYVYSFRFLYVLQDSSSLLQNLETTVQKNKYEVVQTYMYVNTFTYMYMYCRCGKSSLPLFIVLLYCCTCGHIIFENTIFMWWMCSSFLQFFFWIIHRPIMKLALTTPQLNLKLHRYVHVHVYINVCTPVSLV